MERDLKRFGRVTFVWEETEGRVVNGLLQEFHLVVPLIMSKQRCREQ